MAIAPTIEHGVFESMLSESIRVMVHSTNVYPSYETDEKLLAIGTETFININSMEIVSSKDIGELSPAARDCYFDHERRLR